MSYITPDIAGRRQLGKHRNTFEKHLEEIRVDKQDLTAPTSSYQTQRGGWVTFDNEIKISNEEKQKLNAARTFLNSWGYSVSEEDIEFDKAWLGHYSHSRQKQNFGPDGQRIEGITTFLQAIEITKFHVNEAVRLASYLPLPLEIWNFRMAVTKVRIEIEVADKTALRLASYVPKARNSHVSSYPPQREDGKYWHVEALIEKYEKHFEILRPDDKESLGELAIKVLKPGRHKLNVKVLASNLPSAHYFEIEINCETSVKE